MADYQVLIVGAGLAGLHCALRLSTKFPTLTIAIAEAYNYVGGRVVSYSPRGFEGVHWENGAGRIHSSHTLVKNYLRRYGLTETPISSSQVFNGSYYKGKNSWDSFAEILVKSLEHLPPRTLSSHTVQELLDTTFTEASARDLLLRFPYRSEVNTLRADLALAAFKAEMGTNSNYTCVREGLSALTAAMKEELERRGVTFLMRHRLSAVEPNTTPIVCKFKTTNAESKKGQPQRGHARILADKVILALHSKALKGVSPFANLPVLRHLSMKPLLRTYAIFKPSSMYPRPGKVWFEDMPHTVTDTPLRYIIPINPKQGTIMTSYTDADDTRPWMKILEEEGEEMLGKTIVKQLRQEFSGVHIPDPEFFKAHPWSEGCTYWLPGSYSPEEESEKVMCPQPTKWQTLYVCGESYSLRQAWMEGALEHAEAMIKKYFL